MQTKEYVGKYIKLVEYKTLPDSEFVRLTKELFWELVDEFKKVAEARHISTMYGIDNLTKEFNQKANRIKIKKQTKKAYILYTSIKKCA